MAYINVSNYKLEGKSVNQLAFLLYQTNNSQELVNQLILTFTLENLVKTKNNGLISNLLVYFISIGDTNKIMEILKYSQMNNFTMMKRDYLNLAKYFYQIDIDISMKFFSQVLIRTSTNTDSIILSKDIDFIIENKMFNLLTLISGLFIESSNLDYPLVNADEKSLELKTIDSDINLNIKQYIEKILGIDMVSQLKHYVSLQTKSFDAIIDGGNVLHSRTGHINPNSLSDLEIIISQVKKNIGNSLLVIHRRHLKTWPNLTSHLNKLKQSYYLTPYNMNDDTFILWFFLNYNSTPFIISNDRYRDHIFKFETSKKSSGSIYNFSQFNHILHQQTLGYDILTQNIDFKPRYSKCIQIQNDKIYVPHTSGQFIELDVS
jgi:hypothetical protein